MQCLVLQAGMAGYHEHIVQRASAAQRRHLSDDALLVHIKAVPAQAQGSYGWPRTWKEVLARSTRVGKERGRKLMQLHGIRAKGKRRFKVTTHGQPALTRPSSHTNQLERGPRVCRLTDPASVVDGFGFRSLTSNSAGGIRPIVPCGRTSL